MLLFDIIRTNQYRRVNSSKGAKLALKISCAYGNTLFRMETELKSLDIIPDSVFNIRKIFPLLFHIFFFPLRNGVIAIAPITEYIIRVNFLALLTTRPSPIWSFHQAAPHHS